MGEIKKILVLTLFHTRPPCILVPNSIATSSDSRLSTTMSVQPHLPFASTSRSPSTSTLPSPRPTFGTSDQYNSMTDQSLFPLASSNLSDYRIATSDRSPSGSGHSTPLSFTAEKEKPKRGRKKGKKVVELKGEIQLIGDLPVAEESVRSRSLSRALFLQHAGLILMFFTGWARLRKRIPR